MSSSATEDESEAQFPRSAVGVAFAACLLIGVVAGLIGGPPLFQAVMTSILAVSVVLFAVQIFRRELGGVVGAVSLAAFLSLFILSLIGSVAGWLPPGVCDGGC
jgi:hypothetical protein